MNNGWGYTNICKAHFSISWYSNNLSLIFIAPFYKIFSITGYQNYNVFYVDKLEVLNTINVYFYY